MPRTPITGTVNITHYTPYADDVFADDALFNIFADTRLVLTGDDLFLDDTIAMAGQLRVRGPLEVNGLHLDDTVSMVNVDTVAQSGYVFFGSSSEPADDVVTIRNLPGATWDMTTDVHMTVLGGTANFVNLGLLEKTGGDVFSVVETNVRSLGVVEIDTGTLVFDGPNSRFFGDIVGAGAVSFVNSNVFLDNMTISVGSFSAGQIAVRGDVTSFSITDIGNLTLQNGATLTLTETATGQSLLNTTVSGSGSLVIQGDAEIAYLKLLGNTQLNISGTLTVASSAGGAEDLIDATNSPTAAVSINVLAGGFFVDNVSTTTGAINIGQDYPVDGTLTNGGTMEFNNNLANLKMPFENDGLVEIGNAASAAGSSLSVIGAVTGTGSFELSSGADLELFQGVSAGQTVDFAGGSTAGAGLWIGSVSSFEGTISGFGADGRTADTITLDSGVIGLHLLGYTADSDGAGGTLMFTDNTSGPRYDLRLTGSYNAADFHETTQRFSISITYG